ncbi:hypothetical protein [Clostridium psychrophilum]|uniref:hypothetical protein n=1 Tax=Clostridium psychrophilum TaxID=132926 RepID=UPI001C0CF0C2|nr:hypothetical protein [Clostridium psychrophilum]MBU3180551.1 hypothetical protein [Clostridium psychrophilum]
MVIGLIFEYLINTNKIKKSKISRLFYDNDESFIKFWEKAQEKGKMIRIFKSVLFTIVIMGIIGIIYLLNKNSIYEYDQSETMSVALLQGFNFGLILSLLQWITGKIRYKNLIK